MTEYVDIRELHPEYTTMGCTECDDEFYAHWGFAMHRDEWYCRECVPEDLRDVSKWRDITVRL